MTDPRGLGHSSSVTTISAPGLDRKRAPEPGATADGPAAEGTAAEGTTAEGTTAEVPAAAGSAATPGFEEIYEAHFTLVWRALRRLGVPDASTEDAAQDVFLAIHRRLGDFEGRSSVRTWVFGFVLRVARDHRRRAARKGGGDPLTEALADRAPGPLAVLERCEQLRLLDRALAALDEDKRAVFVMGEIEQMSAPEMAEVLGIPLNTVYSRWRLARRDLEREVLRLRGGIP